MHDLELFEVPKNNLCVIQIWRGKNKYQYLTLRHCVDSLYDKTQRSKDYRAFYIFLATNFVRTTI